MKLRTILPCAIGAGVGLVLSQIWLDARPRPEALLATQIGRGESPPRNGPTPTSHETAPTPSAGGRTIDETMQRPDADVQAASTPPIEAPTRSTVERLRRGRAFDFQRTSLDFTIARVFASDSVPARFGHPVRSVASLGGPADTGRPAPLEEPWRDARFRAFGLQGAGDVLALGGNDFTFAADVGASVDWYRRRMPAGAGTEARLESVRTALTDYQLRRQRLLTAAMDLCQRGARGRPAAPVTAYYAADGDLYVVESGRSERLESIMASYEAGMRDFPQVAAGFLRGSR